MLGRISWKATLQRQKLRISYYHPEVLDHFETGQRKAINLRRQAISVMVIMMVVGMRMMMGSGYHQYHQLKAQWTAYSGQIQCPEC